jgi:ADP-L-glycero-D-manno-heptose 6-epimerase
MIILTGGAGFIGSCLVAALNKAGRNDVLIVDSLRTGEKWKNLNGRMFIDIVSKEEFREWMVMDDIEYIDAVIHMGACSSTTESDADYLYDNNFRYSTEVAEFAIEHGARFIYASSAATYGDGSRGYDDASMDLRPLNMYGYSKHLFDQWVQNNDLIDKCVGLKLFNVFGPNEYHKGAQASMAYKAFVQARSTGTIKLFRSNDPQYVDGGQMRDFIYVKDVVQIVMTLLDRTDINGLYNVGTGKARTWNDLAQAIITALGGKGAIEYIDMPAELQHQYQNHTEADMTRLRSVITDLTTTTLEDALADYVSGYLEKAWPYYEG